jgi:hypothetical protein
MGHASLVPSLHEDVHFVLCDFGRAGLAYVETDPAEADATTIVQNLLRGQYERPLRVIALNADEGWSRDVSEAIAAKVRDRRARRPRADDGNERLHRGPHRARESADLAAVVTTRIWRLIFHGSTPTYPKTRGSWLQCCKPVKRLRGDRGRIH